LAEKNVEGNNLCKIETLRTVVEESPHTSWLR